MKILDNDIKNAIMANKAAMKKFMKITNKNSLLTMCMLSMGFKLDNNPEKCLLEFEEMFISIKDDTKLSLNMLKDYISLGDDEKQKLHPSDIIAYEDAIEDVKRTTIMYNELVGIFDDIEALVQRSEDLKSFIRR